LILRKSRKDFKPERFTTNESLQLQPLASQSSFPSISTIPQPSLEVSIPRSTVSQKPNWGSKDESHVIFSYLTRTDKWLDQGLQFDEIWKLRRL
jgi:hypothetical protein